jgi:hypothetical protein
MAHVCDELRLVLARYLKLVALLGDLLEQSFSSAIADWSAKDCIFRTIAAYRRGRVDAIGPLLPSAK